MTGALFYVDSFHEELMRADFPAGKLLGRGGSEAAQVGSADVGGPFCSFCLRLLLRRFLSGDGALLPVFIFFFENIKY